MHIFSEDTALFFNKSPMEFGFCLMKCDLWPIKKESVFMRAFASKLEMQNGHLRSCFAEIEHFMLFKILFSFKFSNERKCRNNYGNISFLRKTLLFFASVNSCISLSPGLFKRCIVRFVEETFCTLKIASN